MCSWSRIICFQNIGEKDFLAKFIFGIGSYKKKFPEFIFAIGFYQKTFVEFNFVISS